MNVTVGDSHNFSMADASAGPRLQMEAASFDHYAEAALALKRANVRRHGPSPAFKWVESTVVFTDSEPLKLALEMRLDPDKAAQLDLGQPQRLRGRRNGAG